MIVAPDRRVFMMVVRDRPRGIVARAVHRSPVRALIVIDNEISLPNTMIRKSREQHLDSRVAEVLRFERHTAPRLRAATRTAFLNEVNAMQLGVFRELLRGPCSPGWLAWRLGVDPGNTSRAVRLMALMGLVTITVAARDRRMRDVELTDWGRDAARYLETFERDRVRSTLEPLPRRQQDRLVRAMQVIMEISERDDGANFVDCLREEGRIPRRKRRRAASRA